MTIQEIELIPLALDPRKFILDEDARGPDGEIEIRRRIELAVRASVAIDYVRTQFKETPARMLEVTSSRKYTTFETDSPSLAVLIETYFKTTFESPMVIHKRPYGGMRNHIISVKRIAEFNFRLDKK